MTRTEGVELLDVSHQTARTAIQELEDEGALQETTGTERYQEYKAVSIVDILTRSFDDPR